MSLPAGQAYGPDDAEQPVRLRRPSFVIGEIPPPLVGGDADPQRVQQALEIASEAQLLPDLSHGKVEIVQTPTAEAIMAVTTPSRSRTNSLTSDASPGVMSPATPSTPGSHSRNSSCHRSPLQSPELPVLVLTHVENTTHHPASGCVQDLESVQLEVHGHADPHRRAQGRRRPSFVIGSLPEPLIHGDGHVPVPSDVNQESPAPEEVRRALQSSAEPPSPTRIEVVQAPATALVAIASLDVGSVPPSPMLRNEEAPPRQRRRSRFQEPENEMAAATAQQIMRGLSSLTEGAKLGETTSEGARLNLALRQHSTSSHRTSFQSPGPGGQTSPSFGFNETPEVPSFPVLPPSVDSNESVPKTRSRRPSFVTGSMPSPLVGSSDKQSVQRALATASEEQLCPPAEKTEERVAPDTVLDALGHPRRQRSLDGPSPVEVIAAAGLHAGEAHKTGPSLSNLATESSTDSVALLHKDDSRTSFQSPIRPGHVIVSRDDDEKNVQLTVVGSAPCVTPAKRRASVVTSALPAPLVPTGADKASVSYALATLPDSVLAGEHPNKVELWEGSSSVAIAPTPSQTPAATPAAPRRASRNDGDNDSAAVGATRLASQLEETPAP